ncbi:LysR family transcriptional regulator [Sphingomonas sp. AP4-R1]|uniref:LysR family transcriptional regulator n=1 Tax=Sphingomonas sp. AP4-R1 TaxID=2735134 RepID=UPI001493BECE|nr:LysR family transcriptional regulator [Sphingomonas sp. AP4-R1]QJU57382.1 LysR family transcriptional regulator [Sphingomonas sp. AP4-R1]
MKREHLTELAAFAVLAEECNFTRAAAKLGTSQSALSHTIKRLEERLGVRLLTRTTRKVAPTDAGERLLGTLRPALDSIEVQLADLSEFREKPAGTVRITTSRHAANLVLWPAIQRLIPEYPDVHVELSIDSALADIVGDRFDAGVRLGEAIAKDMIALRIGPDLRMLIVGSPDYLAAHGIPKTPQDLAAHQCINLRLNTAGGLYAWELERKGREVKVRVEGQLAFNDTDMIMKAAEAGMGLGFLMEDQVRCAVAAGRLVAVMEDWCPSFPGYHLYYPSRRQASPAFRIFVDALRSSSGPRHHDRS